MNRSFRGCTGIGETPCTHSWAVSTRPNVAAMASRAPALLALSDDLLTSVLSLLDQETKWG